MTSEIRTSFFHCFRKLFSFLAKKYDLKKKTLLCDACKFAKHTRASYFSSNSKYFFSLPLWYGEWGPTWVVSLIVRRWFFYVIDCYSRLAWVYLMNTKSEVTSYLKRFDILIPRLEFCEVITRWSIKKVFSKIISDHGIIL